ncbi:Uncharacterised protein [Shigella sonnei]|nr:Uncharacterised protein [Shigella sonnei]
MNGVLFRHIVDQCFTQQCHIARGTELPRRIQTVHRLEGSVGQTQFFGITIHQTNK